jgi:hypothetical protein
MTLHQRYGGPGRRAISRPRERRYFSSSGEPRVPDVPDLSDKGGQEPAQAFMWVFVWAAVCGARTSDP